MLAQRARLLALYAGLVYNFMKTRSYNGETQHIPKILNMIFFFIDSGEKSSQHKNFHLYKERAMLFIGPKILFLLLFLKSKQK